MKNVLGILLATRVPATAANKSYSSAGDRCYASTGAKFVASMRLIASTSRRRTKPTLRQLRSRPREDTGKNRNWRGATGPEVACQKKARRTRRAEGAN
jgi:hypothetical protein